jgi:NTE family protein
VEATPQSAELVFNPLPVPLGLPFQGGIAEREQRKAWEEAVNALRLTDGGNYDNMGLEPAWSEKAQLHELLLVSDAGGLLSFEADKDIFWRVQRYQAIQERQTRALRQRWLFDASRRGNPYAAYWSTRSATTKYPHVTVPGYSKELAREVIAEIRTDLDSFSVAEASVLENHGYCLAEAAVRAHVPPPFQPPPDIPFEPPHRRWMPGQVSEDAIRTELRGSDRQRVLGRWR